MTKPGVQAIFQEGYAEFERGHPLSRQAREAAWRLMNCRTAVMGGHVEFCEEGHFERNHYNSCRHRLCPQCSFAQNQKWLEFQKERLLECAHYHVIFTLPHELNALWKTHEKELTNLLFHNASETLRELLEDSQYLEASCGWMASLHTWSRELSLHPHLHVLVTAGGLKEGKWVEKPGEYLLPFGVARDLFRGKMRASLMEKLNDGTLQVPPASTLQKGLNELNRLGREKWNVKICPKYEYGDGVLIYLSQYFRGSPVGKGRILSVEEGQVTLKTGRGTDSKVVKFSVETFMSRFLQHVPPKSSIRVRSYGLYSNSARQKSWETARQLLKQRGISPRKPSKPVLERVNQKLSEILATPQACPICGKILQGRRVDAIRNPAERKERKAKEPGLQEPLEPLEKAA